MARSDRPFFRHLVKVGARLLLGASRAHVQDWFPGLRLEKPTNGETGAAFYRGRQVATISASDAICQRSGSAIYIVGSGPSIRDADLTRLPEQSAVLLNGAVSLIGDIIEKPLAVAVEDERFIFRHFDLMQRVVPMDIPCLLSVSAIRAICERQPDFLSGRTIVLIDNILRPYKEKRRSLEEASRLPSVIVDRKQRAGMSLDPDQGVFQAGSVAVSALQFALHCRPRSIGFLGIDISNAATQARFYEKSGSVAFSGVARAEDAILSHFELARTVATERDIALVNHSAVSALIKVGFDYDDRFASIRASLP